MPRGDRTGPTGMGARTGRATGFCTGLETAGYENRTAGRRNFGVGCRRGRRRNGNNQQIGQRGYFNGPQPTMPE